MSKTKNILIDKMNELKRYYAEDTGVPCLAFDDVEKLIEKGFEKEREKIMNGLNCGLTLTGFYEDGEPEFTGTNEQWAKFNDGDF